jgi:uncharacterized protein YkwD
MATTGTITTARRLGALLLAAMIVGALAPAAGLARTRRTRHHSRVAVHRRHHRHTTAHASAPATTSTPAVTVPAVCPNANTPALGAPAATLRAAVDCLVNQQRVDRNLPALTESAPLDSSAQSWTDEMVSTGVFSHGTAFEQRLAAVGYDWSNAGENIATGFETPATAVTAWMASLGHCQNILNPVYANVGTGVNPNPVSLVLGNGATWTQDFGLLMGANAPSRNTAPMNGCPYG